MNKGRIGPRRVKAPTGPRIRRKNIPSFFVENKRREFQWSLSKIIESTPKYNVNITAELDVKLLPLPLLFFYKSLCLRA